MHPLFLAILSGISFALYIVCMRIAGPHIQPLLGAILTSATAVLIGLGALLLAMKSATPLVYNPRGILYACGAGLFAFFIEFFGLWAYARGLSVSVGSPIIWGGGIAIAAAVGYCMGEPLSLWRSIGILLTLTGIIFTTATASS